MAQRNISVSDVQKVIDTGEIIEDYPNDFPYPSKLQLGFLDLLDESRTTLEIICST